MKPPEGAARSLHERNHLKAKPPEEMDSGLPDKVDEFSQPPSPRRNTYLRPSTTLKSNKILQLLEIYLTLSMLETFKDYKNPTDTGTKNVLDKETVDSLRVPGVPNGFSQKVPIIGRSHSLEI
jgi:hypothetical protein